MRLLRIFPAFKKFHAVSSFKQKIFAVQQAMRAPLFQEYIWRPDVFICLMQSFCGMVMTVWTIGYWWPSQHIVTNSSSRSHYPWIINQRDSWQSEDQKAMMTTESSCQIATNIKDLKTTLLRAQKKEHFPQGSLLPTWSTHLMRAHSKIPMSHVQVIYASICIHLSQCCSRNDHCPNSQRLLLYRLPIENRCGSAKLLLQSLADWAFTARGTWWTYVLWAVRWWTSCVTTIIYIYYIYIYIFKADSVEVLVTFFRKTYRTVWNLGLNYKSSKQTGFHRIGFFVIFSAMGEHTSHFEKVR